MNNFNNQSITIIGSAWKEGYSLLNNYCRHTTAINYFHALGVKAKTSIGSYMNQQEISIVLHLHRNETMYQVKLDSILHHFLNTYQQDCVLIVLEEQGNESVLVDWNNRKTNLSGTFHEVDKETALNHIGFTYLEGKYYIVS